MTPLVGQIGIPIFHTKKAYKKHGPMVKAQVYKAGAPQFTPSSRLGSPPSSFLYFFPLLSFLPSFPSTSPPPPPPPPFSYGQGVVLGQNMIQLINKILGKSIMKRFTSNSCSSGPASEQEEMSDNWLEGEVFQLQLFHKEIQSCLPTDGLH